MGYITTLDFNFFHLLILFGFLGTLLVEIVRDEYISNQPEQLRNQIKFLASICEKALFESIEFCT